MLLPRREVAIDLVQSAAQPDASITRILDRQPLRLVWARRELCSRSNRHTRPDTRTYRDANGNRTVDTDSRVRTIRFPTRRPPDSILETVVHRCLRSAVQQNK